jgi:hypothetical protein
VHAAKAVSQCFFWNNAMCLRVFCSNAAALNCFFGGVLSRLQLVYVAKTIKYRLNRIAVSCIHNSSAWRLPLLVGPL